MADHIGTWVENWNFDNLRILTYFLNLFFVAHAFIEKDMRQNAPKKIPNMLHGTGIYLHAP